MCFVDAVRLMRTGACGTTGSRLKLNMNAQCCSPLGTQVTDNKRAAAAADPISGAPAAYLAMPCPRKPARLIRAATGEQGIG